jgi:hypothetical protein
MLFIPFTRDRHRIPIDFIVINLGRYGIFYSFLKIKRKIDARRFKSD